MKNFDDEMSKSGTRVPLKTSIIKWCKDTNQFAIYDYDPVDTLGDVLPYQIRQLDKQLRKSKYYDLDRYLAGEGWVAFWTTILILAFIAGLVISIIVLAKTIGSLTILAAFGIFFLEIFLTVVFITCLCKYLENRKKRALLARSSDFQRLLDEFRAGQNWIRDMNFLSITIGDFGAYLKLEFGDNYVDKVNGRAAHEYRTFAESRNAKSQRIGGTNYPDQSLL